MNLSALGGPVEALHHEVPASALLITNQSVDVGDNLAWVTLEENLVDRGETHAIAATSAFALTADGWGCQPITGCRYWPHSAE